MPVFTLNDICNWEESFTGEPEKSHVYYTECGRRYYSDGALSFSEFDKCEFCHRYIKLEEE
jgi:hypothetical protein